MTPECLEPAKRRKVASGSGLEKGTDGVDVDSYGEIEDKTFATKQPEDDQESYESGKSQESGESGESEESDRPEHHHEQPDVPEKLQGAGFDFSFYTKMMLKDIYPSNQKIKPALFSKKPLLNIGQLKNYEGNTSTHISKNKLSEKMGRRDIQFYDLYKRNKPRE